MARLNDFIDMMKLEPLRQYCEEHGERYRYAKGECLVEQGMICRWFALVKSGYFKFCATATNGTLCVTGFSFSNDVTTDYVRSFLLGKPSRTSIIAGADTEVVRIPLSRIKEFGLSQKSDFFEYASSILLDEAYGRYLDQYTMTPLERYRHLVDHCPGDISEVPLNEFASYLRVSRRQFLRIRDEVKKYGRVSKFKLPPKG